MKQINRYQILAPLGGGGMALVYRAYDPHFKREVAIKVIASHFSHNPQFHQRFSNEAQLIASLQHPAIVPVYDFGEENGRPYLVMALMQGGSLTTRLQQGPLSLQQTIQLLRAIAPALDLAHQKGIVHRDLKPDNILFDEQNNPYVADFGIAKLLLQSSMGLSQSGIGIGTPSYMSPEQARGQKNIDGRSDIYSLGVMAFYMLTGQFPYEADTPLGVIYQHINDPIPNIRRIRADLPPGCETVMAHAMAKNPEQRYATVSQMVDALDAVAKGSYQSAPLPRTTVPPLSYEHIVSQQQPVVESPVYPSTAMISAIIGSILGIILLISVGLMMNSSPSESRIGEAQSTKATEPINTSELTETVASIFSNVTVTAQAPAPQTVTTEGQSDKTIATITAQAAIDAQQAAQQATQTAAAVQTAEAQALATAGAAQGAAETAEAAQAAQAAQATQAAQAAAAQATEQAQAAAAQATQQAQAAAAQATQQAQAAAAQATQQAIAAAQATQQAQAVAAQATQQAIAATQTAEAQRLAAAQQAAIAATQTAEAQRLADAEAERLAAAEAERLERLAAEAAVTQTAIAAATLTAQARAITVYRVEPTTFVCGPRPANDSNDNGRIGIRLIPDDQNAKIQVELSKCSFTPFGKSGSAFVYIDGVQTLGPYRYSSGQISHHFNISPFKGRHSYQLYIYPDGEDGQPPHISGAVSAWDEVIYP